MTSFNYERLTFSAKRLRSAVIAQELEGLGYRGVVCFSCGNAAQALRDVGCSVLEVGPCGVFQTKKWWRPEEINRTFPHLFDATSGHLSFAMMQKIAVKFRETLGNLSTEKTYIIPTGSGETLVCLKLIYPDIRFIAEYDNSNKATMYNADAPLNSVVRLLSEDVVVL